jgi:multisubunit Na+/H+ antiporter MnhE subunit
MKKEELNNFEKSVVKILRLKMLDKMEYPGSIVIHFSKDKKTKIVRPVSAEKREIRA